jgi:hypothetical protein
MTVCFVLACRDNLLQLYVVRVFWLSGRDRSRHGMSGRVHIFLRDLVALSGHVMYICRDRSRQNSKKQASSREKGLINFR